MAQSGTARDAAVAALDEVLGQGRPLSELAGGAFAALDAPTAARAQRLTLTVLRHLEQADRVLTPHLRKAPPLTVWNAMRLAVVEMAVDGVAAHGAVNAAVEHVRRGKRTGPLAGLANAVLRRVAQVETPFAGLPPQRMPQWLRQPLVHRLGRDAVSAIEAVQAQIPPLDLTLRDPGSVPVWPEGLGVERLPTGSWRLTGSVQVSALPGYAEGAFWVQDTAAALAATVLGVAAGERVLDLCAAPGGKTMQIAAAGAHVTALDMSGPRMERLRANLSRTGLAAEIVVADALHWQPDALFDAVLLDAPCSATGTIRRHPDLPFVRDGSDLAALTDLQGQLLDRALGMLRPGGRMVYCTCSLLPEEGEAQIAAALARHPGLTVEAADAPGLEPAWRTPDGTVRLRPDLWAARGGMDGFFIARLRKPG